MVELPTIDTRDRVDGSPHSQRWRRAPPDTGRGLVLRAASTPKDDRIEIGTSVGSPSMWLSLARRARDRTLTTYENLGEKAHVTAPTSAAATRGVVRLVQSDFLTPADSWGTAGYCVLDVEWSLHEPCVAAVAPLLSPGDPTIADSVLSHRADP